jgi:hypothetical protein
MRRRFVPLLAAAALPLLAGCTDKSPTLQGGESFPNGRPVTLQTTLDGGPHFQVLGRFAGYPASRNSPAFLEIAGSYHGLDSHALLRFTLPDTVAFSMDGNQRADSVAAFTGGRLVAPLDSLGSTGAPVTFTLWALDQAYDPATATWTLASDTGGVATPWRTPGGTPGGALAQYVWNPAAAGDSVLFALDSATVNRIAADGFPGLMVTSSAGTRVRTARFTLKVGAHPRGAPRDTVLQRSLTEGGQQYVFNPEPPRAATALEVGGIRSARTLFRLNLDATVPVCPQGGGACSELRLRDVTLNDVSLLLRPVPVPGGYEPLDSLPVSVRRVLEPELGARAPLGDAVLGSLVTYHPGDTLVALPLTLLARSFAASDTLTGDFALVSEPEANTFGVLWFEATPRVRITYTIPPAPRLP